MTTPIKMTLAVAILAIAMVSNASASTHGVSTYYDTIRPHGHARSDAVYNRAVNACYSSSGQSRTAINDTPAFKRCMLSFGYRFENTQVVQDAPSAAARSSVAQRSYSGPSVTISIGGGDDNDEAANPAAENNDWAAQQEQSAMDAANAGYAQDAATAAANVAAAATFDAQMTVGN
jgi:hypothetical protein